MHHCDLRAITLKVLLEIVKPEPNEAIWIGNNDFGELLPLNETT
ncbi:MAG: hypothetical protein ACFFD2_05885 [Promethearchaeota archaeon]